MLSLSFLLLASHTPCAPKSITRLYPHKNWIMLQRYPARSANHSLIAIVVHIIYSLRLGCSLALSCTMIHLNTKTSPSQQPTWAKPKQL